MRLYCDMDMVLVHQTGRERFDVMPWMTGGKELWAAIKDRNPILLSQVRQERFGLTAQEKLAWVDRELGQHVPVIFTPSTRGKGHFARPGDILIDDGEQHCANWRANGGLAIRHSDVSVTLQHLKTMLAA